MMKKATTIPGKKPSQSEVIKTEIVCPNDTNPMGILQGGKLVQWMDIAAAVCAQNHSEHIAVTASIDNVSFKRPAKIGDVIIIKANITRAFNTSMEIFVEAYVKSLKVDVPHLINEAYFTFVVLSENGKDVSFIPVLPETKLELEKHDRALEHKLQKFKD